MPTLTPRRTAAVLVWLWAWLVASLAVQFAGIEAVGDLVETGEADADAGDQEVVEALTAGRAVLVSLGTQFLVWVVRGVELTKLETAYVGLAAIPNGPGLVTNALYARCRLTECPAGVFLGWNFVQVVPSMLTTALTGGFLFQRVLPLCTSYEKWGIASSIALVLAMAGGAFWCGVLFRVVEQVALAVTSAVFYTLCVCYVVRISYLVLKPQFRALRELQNAAALAGTASATLQRSSLRHSVALVNRKAQAATSPLDTLRVNLALSCASIVTTTLYVTSGCLDYFLQFLEQPSLTVSASMLVSEALDSTANDVMLGFVILSGGLAGGVRAASELVAAARARQERLQAVQERSEKLSEQLSESVDVLTSELAAAEVAVVTGAASLQAFQQQCKVATAEVNQLRGHLALFYSTVDARWQVLVDVEDRSAPWEHDPAIVGEASTAEDVVDALLTHAPKAREKLESVLQETCDALRKATNVDELQLSGDSPAPPVRPTERVGRWSALATRARKAVGALGSSQLPRLVHRNEASRALVAAVVPPVKARARTLAKANGSRAAALGLFDVVRGSIDADDPLTLYLALRLLGGRGDVEIVNVKNRFVRADQFLQRRQRRGVRARPAQPESPSAPEANGPPCAAAPLEGARVQMHRAMQNLLAELEDAPDAAPKPKDRVGRKVSALAAQAPLEGHAALKLHILLKGVEGVPGSGCFMVEVQLCLQRLAAADRGVMHKLYEALRMAEVSELLEQPVFRTGIAPVGRQEGGEVAPHGAGIPAQQSAQDGAPGPGTGKGAAPPAAAEPARSGAPPKVRAPRRPKAVLDTE